MILDAATVLSRTEDVDRQDLLLYYYELKSAFTKLQAASITSFSLSYFAINNLRDII